jgi:3-methyladenine DNA glycosylase AlkD
MVKLRLNCTDMLKQLQREIKKLANPQKEKLLQRFFKTGKGEYAEGDIFLGIMVPQSRKLAKKYADLNIKQLTELIRSKIHEERLIALFILINKYKTTNHKNICFHFYIKNMKYINNWDLVDLSAPNIVGEHLLNSKSLAPQPRFADVVRQSSVKPSLVSASLSKSRQQTGTQPTFNSSESGLLRPIDILESLAKSENIWERRIAVLATFQFIKNNKFAESLEIAKILLQDKHDLIHKAVGWMLREIGKRDQAVEIEFLNKYYEKMPRTMLRYAIEKFPEELRQDYLLNRV